MRQLVEDTCEVLCEDNGCKMVADLLSFREHDHLAVSIEKQLKLEMRWNGQIYEGRIGSKTFTSDGPLVRNYKQGRK
jgi:hypothetical protein